MQPNVASTEVIVIDDIPLVVNRTVRTIRKQSYACEGFTDPTEALAFLAQPNQVKVAIIDLTMPVMDGFEVVQQIRAMGLDIYCIAASASVNDYHTESALEGFDQIVEKPIKTDVIIDAMDSVLNRKAVNVLATGLVEKESDLEQYKQHLSEAQHKLELAMAKHDESLVLVACHELRESPLLVDMPSIINEIQRVQFLASIHQLKMSNLVDINEFVKCHITSLR